MTSVQVELLHVVQRFHCKCCNGNIPDHFLCESYITCVTSAQVELLLQSCIMLLRDCYLFCAVVLARLAVIHSVCPVLVSPASVCGDTVANTSLCNSLTALRHCTNATYSVVTNVTNCSSAGEKVQLVVISSNVTHVLSEQVVTSATIMHSQQCSTADSAT